MATLPKIPATPVGQQVQPVFPIQDPMEREKMMQPDQQPMQAVINGGEEVIPADVVNLLGGSKGLTNILNSVLATKGVKLSGDKGRAGAGASGQPQMPNMACGTVGHVVPNYSTGTVGLPDPLNPPAGGTPAAPALGTPTAAPGVPATPNLNVTSGFSGPGNFQVPGIGQQSTGQNQDVLTAAQNKALAGTQSNTLGMTSGLTQNMLQNPQGQLGSPQQRMQTGIEQYDYNQAQAMEGARQQLAPILNTGAGASKLIDLGTRGALDRSVFQRDLEKSLSDESLANIYKAIEAGRQTSEQERKGYETDIGALVDVRGAAEGQENRNFEAERTNIDNKMKLAMQSNDINQRNEAIRANLEYEKWKTEAGMQLTREESALNRAFELTLQSNDIQAQDNLMRLKGMIDEGLLIKGQEFTAIQADLDRQQQLLLQANDYVGAEKIERIKQEFQAVEAEKTRQFQTAERVATQSWTSSERLSSEDFELGRMYYESELAEARAQNDFGREQQLLESQQLHELKMQTNEMDYGQKMAYLQYNLQEARANNDVERQKTLLTFQHGQEMERLANEQGFEAAMQYNQFAYQSALSAQDFTQAEVLQRQSLEFQATENAKDRLLEEARIQLQQQGMDMTIFDRLQSEVEAGRIEPDAAMSYLQQTISQGGYNVTLNPVDIETQTRNAINAEYDSMVYQFQKTHPEMTPEEAQAAFFDWYNENQYGMPDVAAAVVDSSLLVGGADPNNPNYSKYNALLAQAQPLNLSAKKTGGGAFNGMQTTYEFGDGAPASGTPFTWDGVLYVVTSGVALQKEGYPNYEYFTAKDVNTGKEIKFDARNYYN